MEPWRAGPEGFPAKWDSSWSFGQAAWLQCSAALCTLWLRRAPGRGPGQEPGWGPTLPELRVVQWGTGQGKGALRCREGLDWFCTLVDFEAPSLDDGVSGAAGPTQSCPVPVFPLSRVMLVFPHSSYPSSWMVEWPHAICQAPRWKLQSLGHRHGHTGGRGRNLLPLALQAHSPDLATLMGLGGWFTHVVNTHL